MSLSLEDSWKLLLVPGRIYYPHKINSEIRKGEPELANLRAIVSNLDGVAIDVGANRGIYSYALARLFSRVMAFEPNPDVARFARRKLPGNVEVLEVALGAREHSDVLHVPIVRDRRVHLLGSLRQSSDGEAAQVPVEVRTLDGMAVRDVRFIKIDVEGAEEEVLRGAARTIGRDRPVLLIEVFAGHYSDPVDFAIQLGNSYGYDAKVMDRWSRLRPIAEVAEEDRSASRNVVFLPRV